MTLMSEKTTFLNRQGADRSLTLTVEGLRRDFDHAG